MIDIEGNELELLEGLPVLELANFDLIVECHDCFQPTIGERLTRHFSTSHRQLLLKNTLLAADLPPLFEKLGHLDQLLATWEWRMGPTPWMIAASHVWPDSEIYRAVSNAQS